MNDAKRLNYKRLHNNMCLNYKCLHNNKGEGTPSPLLSFFFLSSPLAKQIRKAFLVGDLIIALTIN